jgi:hypothetical protein
VELPQNPEHTAMPKSAENDKISQAMLADLAGLESSFFRLNRDELPAPCATVPSGGRPAPVYCLDTLAEFIHERTANLTDAECRLRCALSAKLRKPRSPDGEQQS